MRTKDLDQIQLIDLDPKVRLFCLGLAHINSRYDSRIGRRWKLSRLTLTSQAWRNTTAWNVQSTFSAARSICDAESIFRYYETDAALHSHWRSKVHKRRLKQLKVPAYTIEESERAAGLGREVRRATAVVEVAPAVEMVDAM